MDGTQSREQPARAGRPVLAATCAALAACGRLLGGSDPGPAITKEPIGFALTWTGDDSDVVFAVCCRGLNVPDSLNAYSLSNGRERTLDSGKGYFGASSQPGSDVFFVGAVPSSSIGLDMRLFAASSGRELAELHQGVTFVLAPYALRIAFVRDQRDASGTETSQTFILDVASGSETELAQCLVPRVFSPDGSRILCNTSAEVRSGYPFGTDPATIEIASGSATPVPETFGAGEVIWTSSGLRVVYPSNTEPGDVVVEDAATGKRTILKSDEVPGYVFVRDNWSLIPPSWSRDGTRLAFWKLYCGHSPDGACPTEAYSPGIVQARLVVIDVAHATSRVVAFGDYYGPFVFSNDGRRIAYLCDGALRLRDLD